MLGQRRQRQLYFRQRRPLDARGPLNQESELTYGSTRLLVSVGLTSEVEIG